MPTLAPTRSDERIAGARSVGREMWLKMMRRRLWARDMCALANGNSMGTEWNDATTVRVRGKSGRDAHLFRFRALVERAPYRRRRTRADRCADQG